MGISIKMRLTLLGTILAFIPALIISLLIKNAAIKDASTIIEADARNKLVALRDVTSVNIQDYLNFINDQLITYSSNLMVIDAMKSFSPAFHEYVKQISDSELANTSQELQDFYRNQFDQQFQSLNGGQTSSPNRLYEQAGKAAWVMQSLYISGNTNPLGEKHKLVDTKQNDDYSRLHAKFHPSITQYQQLFGYYDIFFVDAETGHIVYSVFKELDYATSLKDGPYANSGIGEAYKMALTATDKDQTFLTDFAPYQPSYNGSASFISSPIFDGSEKIGVMIFQMPVDKINDVMNHHNDWLNSGLGETGETYLVGSDKTMRSNSRGLIENKQAYLDMLSSSGVPAPTIQALDTKDNTIGIQVIDTQGVQNALKGETGVASYRNASEKMVLSAYKPLEILGLNWAILSEITQEEAFREVKLLENRLSSQILYFVVGFLLLGGLLGWGLAYIITRPINKVITTVYGISEGEGDLTQRLQVKGKDETASLAKGINLFIGHIDETFSAILNSVVRLIPISQDIASVNEKINKASQEQKSFSDEINKQLNETNEAAKLVNDKLEQIHSAATSGDQVVNSSSRAVEDINETMQALSNNICEAVSAINTLTQDTDRISGIIDVINGIAEQTNLLALNAAIEAARAGEAGRGFAVVADEVRTLASKTRQSTDEVTDMVNSIQSSTKSVVNLMDNSQKSAASSSDNVTQAKQELDHVKKAMAAISDRVNDISEAIKAQQSSFMEINNTYEIMGESFQKAQLATAESILVGKDITKLGDTIMQKISQFKVTDQTWSTSQRNQVRSDATDKAP